MTHERNIPIFTVPLDSRNDYQPINYSPDYSWNDEDKNIIKEKVDKLFNSFEKEGEETVDTSVGKIKITYEPHPKGDRRKLIQGFLLEPVKLSANLKEEQWQSIQILYLLQETTPNWIKNNDRASKHFDLIQEEIKQVQLSEEKLKNSAFFSILNLVESLCKESSSDPALPNRLKNLIENLKTFSPSN
ncbi:MAG: hypothetical protein AUK43_14850 [Oscillatoriales cyanobacterium CG2_30_40_61]|nr:MAG: hypothetical protein AUK43_14850 [Oscillatoriales cyanobacterium CG2_30_40_61]